MSSFVVGKEIFANLTEYPLPEKEGTRDYIFYFVSAGDPYGKGARRFFDRFYKNHRKKHISSLEALIAELHNEVEARGVSHIREIVLVGHATAHGLIFPVVNGVSDPDLKEYKYLTPGSMALLQQEFLDGKFTDFNTKRKKVLSRLTEDSWVTIRACNFGKSRSGLYALYSFFGGRANVYAPKNYQFFGSHPIMPGMRLETKLEVHEHLVKQRFLPHDTHTPDRKDAIVRALADPARFSEPVELVTVDISDSTSAETEEYQEMIANLNSRRIIQPLKTRLREKGGITLSGQEQTLVRVKDASWLIRDTLQHENEDYDVDYHLSEQIFSTDATLVVEANIPGVHSAHEAFPIQLFFFESENGLWRGRLFTLAFHTEDPEADPADEEKFEAVLNLLESGQSPHDTIISNMFIEEEGIELSAGATISLQSSRGEGDNERITWLLKDSERYLIKLEHPLSSTGVRSHTLTVYEHLDEESRLRQEYELMSYLGEDSDLPGTELLAYLDNYSLDELADFINYLRDPYKPEHVVYIHHAVEAQRRKKDYLKWYFDLPEVKEQSEAPLIFTPYELSFKEREDMSALVYDFEPNNHWAEVKASNPPTQPFQDDLFTEQLLEFTAEELAVPGHLEPDSPYTDIEELRELERQGLERFFAVEKFTFDPPDEDSEDINCQEFAEIITQLQGLEGKSAAEIEEALDTIEISEEKTLSFHLENAYKSIKAAFAFLNVAKGTGGIPETVVSRAIRRFPVLGAGRQIRPPYLITFTRALPYIGLVTYMGEIFTQIVADYAKSMEQWENVGTRTAVRQWARELLALTFQKEDNFPARIEIDLGGNVIDRFIEEIEAEAYDGKPHPILRHPEQMQKGFDEGVKMIEREANEILSKADRIMDDVLRQGGLDNCKIGVLRDAGIIDTSLSRALVMRHYAQLILEKVPRV